MLWPSTRATWNPKVTINVAYTAADASKLSDVYKSLGSLLGTKNEKRQITAGFAGGALALLLLGAAMSLRWFGRLI